MSNHINNSGRGSRYYNGSYHTFGRVITAEEMTDAVVNNPIDDYYDQLQRESRKAKRLAARAVRRHGKTYAAGRLGVMANDYLARAQAAEAAGNKREALDFLAAARNHRNAAQRVAEVRI